MKRFLSIPEMIDFKARKSAISRIVVVAMATSSLVPLAALPASAHQYDHLDPYATNCDNTGRAVRTGTMEDRNHNPVGTIKLMWSSSCQTNWTEIWVPSTASGTIWVRTDRGDDSYTYSPGNGGHHWGDMMWAPGYCAWGTATSSNPSSQGNTSAACG